MIKLFGFELNVEEMFVGAMIQYPFYFIIGWWVLWLMVTSGLLWSIGGSKEGEKIVRRVGVALVSVLFMLALAGLKYAPLAIAGCGGAGACWLGYGYNSVLYKFYKQWFYTDKTCTFVTRLTTYILYWVSFGICMHWVR